jgi:hypothetical protein
MLILILIGGNNMTTETKELKQQAEETKFLYKTGQITRDEAAAGIMPFINAFNEKSKEIAKKYNMKPKTINFAGFLR